MEQAVDAMSKQLSAIACNATKSNPTDTQRFDPKRSIMKHVQRATKEISRMRQPPIKALGCKDSVPIFLRYDGWIRKTSLSGLIGPDS